MKELLSRRRELEGDLAATRHQLRGLRAQQKRQEQRGARAWQLSSRLRGVVLILYMLGDWRPEAAMRYLAAAGRKRKWPGREEEDLRELVEKAVLEADASELAGLGDLEAPTAPLAMKEAVAYLEEWRLKVWVEVQNQQKGVAPSTGCLLRRLEERRGSIPAVVRPVAVGFAEEAKARMWAMRWRRRWGGRHGRLRVRDDVGPQEMRDKVPFPQDSFAILRAALR